jgi:hypothetical protein
MEPKRKRRRNIKRRQNYYLSADDKHLIYQLYMAGAKPIDIANQIKISDKTVYKYLKEMFCPADGWRRGFISSAEERSIRMAVEKGESLPNVCTKFRRPMWLVWPVIVKPKGIGAYVEVESPDKIFEVTTHEYIKRIGPDRVPSLGDRIKSFIGRMFGVRSD